MNINQYDIYIGITKNKKLEISEDNQMKREDKSCPILQYYLKEINTLDEIYIPSFYKTPSEIYGMSESDEYRTRIFCNTLIQESGIVLRLPQQTILTAMNTFNRFYWKNSFTIIEPFHVICACLFIATKIEETLRRIREVISSCYYILKKKESGIKIYSNIKAQKEFILDIYSQEYLTIKSNVMALETYILEELGFFLYVLSDHPHKYLIHFIKHLRGTRELLQRSWNYLNDAYRTSLAVNYAPHVLACAAIFLAARIYYFLLPNSINWWEAFGTRIEEIQEVAAEILSLYEIAKIELSDVRNILKKYSKEYKEDEEKRKNLLDINEDKKNKKVYKEYYRTSLDKNRSRSRSRSKNRNKKKKRNRSRNKDSEESSLYRKKRRHDKNKHNRKRKYSYESNNTDNSNRKPKVKRKYSKEKRQRSRSRSYSNNKTTKRKRSYSKYSSSNS